MSGAGGETRLAGAALLRGEAIAGPHLRVADGPEAGRRIPLGEVQTVGRGDHTDVRLEDASASRLHARLSRVGERWLAEDLGSKNGLRINGRRCGRPRRLRPGDELTLGATRLVLEPGLPQPIGAVPEADPVAPEPRRGIGLLAGAGALAALAAALMALAE